MGRRGYVPESRTRQFGQVFLAPLSVFLLGGFVALVAWSVDLTHLLFRLGVALLVGAGLWFIAKGFSLASLRVSTAVALVLIVVMLTRIGNDTRDLQEAATYESTRSELEIELGLLRPNGDVDDAAADPVSEARRLADEAQLRADEATVLALDAARVGDTELEEAVALVRELVREAVVARAEAVAAAADAEAAADAPTITRNAAERADDAANAATLAQEEAERARDEVVVIVDKRQQDVPPGPAENPPRDARAAEKVARAAAALATTSARLADAAADDAEDALRSEMQAARLENRALDGNVQLIANSTVASASRASASAQSAQEASSEAARLLAFFGTCGGLLGELPTLIDFDDAARCGDTLVAGCDEEAADGAPERECRPRLAQRLVLGSYLGAVTDIAASTAADTREPLEAQIAEVQDRITALSEPVPIVDLITTGADDVVTDALSTVTSENIPAGLASFGWVILAISLIVLYRWLEVVNGRRDPGPTTVVIEKEPNDETKYAAEMFRVYLGAVELAEPSPVPGGQAIDSGRKFLEGEGIQNRAVEFVAAVFQATAFPKRGVEIEVACHVPEATAAESGPDDAADDQDVDALRAGAPEPSSPPAEVSIRGLTARNRSLMFSQHLEDPARDRVIEDAAHYAAAQVLVTGYTTPSWLQWGAGDGRGLRAYQKAVLDSSRPRPVLDSDERTRLYEEAVAASPHTGAALVALANERTLDGRLVEAALMLVLARQRNDRYVIARYRLGVTLSMLAGDIEGHWRPDPERNELMDLILSLRGGPYDHVTRPADDREVLLAVARSELRAVAKLLRRRTMIKMAFAQRERRYWLRALRDPRTRALEAAAESAGLLVELRLAKLADEAAPTASNRSIELGRSDAFLEVLEGVGYDDAIVRYNAACLLVEAGRHREAAEQLTMARLARNGGSITLEWATADPDLADLRASGAWPEVEHRLRTIGRWLETDGRGHEIVRTTPS